jgi:hypothetical protein
MVIGQQVQPGQLTAVPATTVTGAQDIGTLLASIMPLIMLMMVMMMMMPMFRGMAKAFEAK